MKQSFYDPGIKAVRVKDRIKFWNVVPGDRIRIRGDSRNTIHEVLSINKFTNRVYLKGTIRVRFTLAPLTVAHMAVGTNQGQDAGEQERTLLEMPIINRGARKEVRGRNYRESAVSISSGPYPQRGPISLHRSVFARRIGVREPYWNPEFRRFDWRRVVLASMPAYVEQNAGEELVLPWPEPEEPPKPKGTEENQQLFFFVARLIYHPGSQSASGYPFRCGSKNHIPATDAYDE